MLDALDKETDGTLHGVIQRRKQAYIPYIEQLRAQKELVLKKFEVIGKTDKICIWGMGNRGMAMLEFCRLEQMRVDGICDANNQGAGLDTIGRTPIYDCEKVLQLADVILASNGSVCKYLGQRHYKGKVINLQEFLPF